MKDRIRAMRLVFHGKQSAVEGALREMERE